MPKKIVVAVLFSSCFFSLSCRGPEGPTGPQGPPGQGGYDLVDPRIQPQVIYTYPPANSIGPYENFSYEILVRFNKIMDIGSVRRAVGITSPDGLVRADSNQVYISNGDGIVIYAVDTLGYPIYSWKVGQSVNLAISSAARDVNGNTLLPPYSMTITPEPYFRVRNTNPQNGSTNATPTYIYIYFNSKIDATIFAGMNMQPPVDGMWWIGDDSTYIYFNPSLGLEEGLSYVVTLNASVHDKYGNSLREPFVLSFAVQAFGIGQTYPRNGESNVLFNTPINVYTTGIIDSSSIRGAFHITPAVRGYMDVYWHGSNFYFHPTQQYVPMTEYTVTIGTALSSISGKVINAPYVFSFTTDSFRVTGTYPFNGSAGISRPATITVAFNGMFDSTSVRNSFSISPPVAGYFYFRGPDYYYRYYSFEYYPTNPLDPNKTYTVSISQAAKMQDGYPLSSPYIFSFTTGP